jgi:hypothetical protein
MVDLKEVAKLILLQVQHNKACGKEDVWTIDEIVDIIERRIFESEIRYTFTQDDLDKLEEYLKPFHTLTNDIFDYGADPNDNKEILPKEIQDKSDDAESSLILIEALFNARKNKN